jgi:hypothetical protein
MFSKRELDFARLEQRLQETNERAEQERRGAEDEQRNRRKTESSPSPAARTSPARLCLNLGRTFQYCSSGFSKELTNIYSKVRGRLQLRTSCILFFDPYCLQH